MAKKVMEPVLGIRSIYTKKEVDGEPSLNAVFMIGYGSPRSETFFTSPQVRWIIEQYNIAHKQPLHHLGEMEITFNHKTKTGDWAEFAPFDSMEALDVFEGKGIAIELEKRFLKRVKREFPTIKKIEHLEPSAKRVRHLTKRGLPLDKFPLEFGFRHEMRRIKKTQKHWKIKNFPRRPV